MHLHLSGAPVRSRQPVFVSEKDIPWPRTALSSSVGSLRKESFTLKIATALARLAPDTLKPNVVTLHDISFSIRIWKPNPPADWVAFREKLQKSNGVLFVTPEYNRSIPGALKNAIDVGSRPYGKSSFLGKPIGNRQQFAGSAGVALTQPSICSISCRAFPVRSSGSPKST